MVDTKISLFENLDSGKNNLIHGININYLTDDLFKRIFNEVIKNYGDKLANKGYINWKKKII